MKQLLVASVAGAVLITWAAWQPQARPSSSPVPDNTYTLMVAFRSYRHRTRGLERRCIDSGRADRSPLQLASIARRNDRRPTRLETFLHLERCVSEPRMGAGADDTLSACPEKAWARD